MQRKRQYFPSAVRFPGYAATVKAFSTSEITTAVPRSAARGPGDGEDLRGYEARRQGGVSDSIETGAIEISAVETKDVSSRPGRLLAPPFGLFLRAALLAHLRRTFR